VSVVSSVDNTCVVDDAAQTADSTGQEKEQEADILSADDLPEDNVEGDSPGLIALAPCCQAAEAGRSDFVIHRDILYHKDQPSVNCVFQRAGGLSVLKMAHDSVFGGHLGEWKTRVRIRLSFFWPGMQKSVLEYVHQCAVSCAVGR